MHWVIHENMFKEDGYRRLISALDKYECSYSLHKVIPFVGTLIPEPELDDDMVIVMGSYSMAFHAEDMGWFPGALGHNDNMDFEKQLPHWGTHMINADAQVSELQGVLPQVNPFFIRPTLDTKSISGTVMDWTTFSKLLGNLIRLGSADNGGYLKLDTKVMICSAKKIYREYRLWVVGGQVVTASLYLEGTRVRYDNRVDERIIDYANEMLSIWKPCESFVLDICETPNGLKILEAGCLSAAGFYAADMQKLVMAIEDIYGAK